MASEKKIDYVLLGLLSHESLSGYDIKKRLDNRLRFFWNASYGSIYPALSKLEEQKYITKCGLTENGREKLIYTITEQGRSYLYTWLQKPVVKDELRYETLLKLFFGNQAGPDITLHHIEEFEQKIRRELPFLQECAHQLAQYPEDATHTYYLLTVHFGIKTYEAYLEWCCFAKKTLDTLKRKGMCEHV